MQNTNTLTECMFMGNNIRVLGTKDELWFVAIDVCKILKIKNSRDAVKRLDEDEKGVVKTDTLGGQQDLQVINESGLYTLILRSRTPEAKQFKRWVTHEVLPRIRKYGYYKLNNDERKFVAYKEIAESLNTNVNDLDDSYAKMPRYRLEAEARRLKYEAKQEEEKESTIKDYPYSYDEMDALCDYDLEYVKTFIPDGEEDKYYKRISNGEEWYSEKFKREIPKFKAMWCGK